MVKTTTIELISKKEFELIRITKDILKAVEESGVQNGVVYAITAHTTSYNHNHFLPSYGAIGCNAPGHLKSMICGNHAVFPIVDGHVVCGNAQDVYFGEFDGIQRRKVYITVMGE